MNDGGYRREGGREGGKMRKRRMWERMKNGVRNERL